MIERNEVKAQGELANKNDSCTVLISIAQRGFYCKGAWMVIPYPAVEAKHIRQFYVTSELKIIFFFLTISAMVWIFIAVKNRYSNVLAARKFTKTQNEPKQGNATHNQ